MNHRPVRAFSFASVIAFMSVVSPSSALADDAQENAAAEALFREGRTLLAQGKLQEACDKFGESKRLDAAPGTLLNLARCYEDLGRTASAWTTYRELAGRAANLGQTARAEFASQKAAELEASLPALIVSVPSAHRIEGLVVELDGTPIGSSAWASRVPIDPGVHRLSASAPGRFAWSESIDAVAATTTNVDVPLLLPVTSPGQSPLKTIGVIATFAGGTAVLAGLVLRGVANMENAAADDACFDGCSPNGVMRRERAGDFTTMSTVVGVGGLSIAAVGVALWILAPRAKPQSAFASTGLTF